MTHESFKQILSWSDNYTKDQVCKFLDNSFDCYILESWFILWQQGKQRQIFEQINSMNDLRANTAKNDVERRPKDWNLSRKKENQNIAN